MTPSVLETGCEWRAEDVRDPANWTEVLSDAELAELDRAVAACRDRSAALLAVGKDDFPLPTLGARLKRIERELMEGRGFVLIRGLPRERYSNDDMCLAYWGIGAHLGTPWPQNHHGHVLGDVTDQGKTLEDPTARGNELGSIGLDYHCDGSDLIGLLCLQTARSGGLSAVANSVALHNELVRQHPELARELYEQQPYDFRGEQPSGARGWYPMPVFTRWGERLFVRLIAAYIFASQRHADAPRLTPAARAALKWMHAEAESGRYSVTMDFQPGDMQFINNYHVLHGRTSYVDDRADGKVRHLKRLWLETESLKDRPPHFRNHGRTHWAAKKSISRLDRDTSKTAE
ncbi:MAG TPA: TauD/TfdA family dioxygenase [Polyangiaceae bacterium]|nr:TauD/TfdA family dioxygenase [Polyangiaceae bacterium]